MHHRGATPEGEQACKNMRALVQIAQNKVPNQHRKTFAQTLQASDKTQLMRVQNGETGQMLNAPDAVLE